MRTVFLIYLLVLLSWSSRSLADGVLSTPCYTILNGELKHVASDFCSDLYNDKFDNKSASGVTQNLTAFKIEVIKSNEGNGSYTTLESTRSILSWDRKDETSAPNVDTTTVKDKKVIDRTNCSRFYKSSKLTKEDSLTCITIDKSFCSRYRKQIAQNSQIFGDLSSEKLKSCVNVLNQHRLALMDAIKNSWNDPKYSELAQKRYEETKQRTDKLLNQEVAGGVIPKYNMSDSNPKSGTDALSKGLNHDFMFSEDRHAGEIFSDCENLFPKASSSEKTKEGNNHSGLK